MTQQIKITDPLALSLLCDVATTRRLKRHLVQSPLGKMLYAAKSIEQALEFFSSAEVTGFWLTAGERSLWVNLSPAVSPLPDPNQLTLLPPETPPDGAPLSRRLDDQANKA